jgi:hypothetical protein
MRRRGAGRLEMRTPTSDRLTRAAAEQLLDGGPGPAGLPQLLAAAASPGTAGELAGEPAALAAFVEAPHASPLPGAPTRRPSMLATALSKVLAAKALAAVVLLAGASGGVALAATVSGAPSFPSTDRPATTATPTAAPSPADDAEPGTEETGAGEQALSAAPSLAGLCNAWAADDPGAAADNPAFGSLVEAAGSPEQVPGYCADLADADRPGRSGTAPGRVGEDPGGPDARGRGAGGRGVPPTAAPGNPDHPTGPPADAGRNGDEQGRNGKGGAEKDGAEKGGAEKGGAQKGGAEKGEAEKGGNAGDRQDGDEHDKGARSRSDDQDRKGDAPAAEGRPAG